MRRKITKITDKYREGRGLISYTGSAEEKRLYNRYLLAAKAHKAAKKVYDAADAFAAKMQGKPGQDTADKAEVKAWELYDKSRQAFTEVGIEVARYVLKHEKK